jgi:hypothetical protein
LDADGNEISTDEEEELERVRAEYRIRRSLNRSRATQSSQTDQVPESIPTSTTGSAFVPITRSTISQERDEPDAARVRINAIERRAMASALDSMLVLDRTRRSLPTTMDSSAPSHTEATSVSGNPEIFGSPDPFVVDPLPMPLCTMLPVCNDGYKERVPHIPVPMHASWAGR